MLWYYIDVHCCKCYILLSWLFLEYCRSFYDLERVREACGGGRLHQTDLGSRHVFREREGGAVSCRHPGHIMFFFLSLYISCCFFVVMVMVFQARCLLFSLYLHVLMLLLLLFSQLFSTTGALVVITVWGVTSPSIIHPTFCSEAP